MCLFLYHHRVQTTNFQINFQMLIVKLNERVSKSTLTVLYPVDKRFYQRFSEVMKKVISCDILYLYLLDLLR